jgi:hypothetical protein
MLQPNPPLFRLVRLTLAIAGCAVALWACTGHPLQAPDPEPEIQTDLRFTVSPDNKLDLIFLVDNSRSMAQEQASLARNFPLFMQELEGRGKLDLHLAVISSDVGAGGLNTDNCRGTGHAGVFRTGNNCGLSDGATFLTIDKQGNKNFTGTLPDVFGCVATVGTGGCGYEHQLQSLRTALYRPEQQNFLRPDAHLGIVLITDEDDCSGEPDATLYAGDRPGEAPNLRCATAGHVCGGMDVPAAAFTAPLASCKPFEHAGDATSKKQRLINISEVVAQIKALKAGTGRQLIVSAIMGWDDRPGASYRIESSSGGLDLAPICAAPNDGPWSMPAVRLKNFVDAFGTLGSWHSMCEPDLAPAIQKIGGTIIEGIAEGVCLPTLTRDTDRARAGLQPECNVIAVLHGGPGGMDQKRVVPSCAGAPAPCWELTDDTQCPGRFLRVSDPARAAAGTLATASCSTCTGPDDPRCAR